MGEAGEKLARAEKLCASPPERFYRKRVSIQELGCDEIYYTNALIFLVKIMLSRKLACLIFFN